MMFQRLPESVVPLYSELLDQAIIAQASMAAQIPTNGSFTTKTINKRLYWYFQVSIGAHKTQHYLGPDSEALRRWVDEVKEARSDSKADRSNRARLCLMLKAGGAATEPAAAIKVLEIIADARVFRLGGVLIGTQAFRLFGNMLGVKFKNQAMQTQDVDIGHDPTIGVALARESSFADVGGSLEDSELEFLPIPQLDARKPSTSFKIRGRERRIDFLTSRLSGRSEEPVFLPAYKLSAHPIKMLDYLIDAPSQAVAIGSRDVLVNVPDPARFALHKLWTSTQRPASFQARARKDVLQASALIGVLAEDRPDDLAIAWETMSRRPRVREKVVSAANGLPENIREQLEAARRRAT